MHLTVLARYVAWGTLIVVLGLGTPLQTLFRPGAPSLQNEQGASLSADPVLVGAGDIADCATLGGAHATAGLLDEISGTVFTLGDNAYPSGTLLQFRNCYGPTWGRFKDRTRPSPGNHEFHSGQAAPYFSYFGANAGDPANGYYSYDLGSWHIIVLNTECDQLGGCQVGTREEIWLRQNLAQHTGACTLAYWHKPLFSSGRGEGSEPQVKPFWRDLYDAHADVVINGHAHNYERFAPQTPDGRPDAAHGIREFVVGTGGKSHEQFGIPLSTSEIRDASTFGVLKLVLHQKSYDWEFVPVRGGIFHDAGRGTCHE